MERITSRQNPFLKQIGKLNNAKSERRRAGVYPGEGPKLLEEAVKAGVKITATVSADTSFEDDLGADRLQKLFRKLS